MRACKYYKAVEHLNDIVPLIDLKVTSVSSSLVNRSFYEGSKNKMTCEHMSIHQILEALLILTIK